MFTNRAWLLLFTCLLTGRLLSAAAASKESLLVLSKGDLTLAIVDPLTLKVLAKIPSGPDPHEVAASTDGKLAFISNYGGGRFNTLTVVDLVGQRPLPTVDLGVLRGPHGLVFAGGKVWFTAEGSKVIGSYDPDARKVDWILGTGQNRTHMLLVSADLKHIVTSNVSSATMTFMEKGLQKLPALPPGPGIAKAGVPPTFPLEGPGPGPNGPGMGPGGPGMGPREDWDETVVPVGRGAEGFDISPDGKELWAANALDGTISILSIEGRRVIQTLDPEILAANRLKFTPDGKLVLVSSLRSSDLTILDVATRKVIKRLPIGHGAAGIQMQPSQAKAYVACGPDNYVAVVDLTSLSVTGHVQAGKEPDGLAWAVRP